MRICVFFTLLLLSTGCTESTPQQPTEEIPYADVAAQTTLIEQKIDEQFPEPTVATRMKRIARCESSGSPYGAITHWRPDGSLVPERSGTSSARGGFQVLLGLHADQIQTMGLDMYNIDDYLTYVKQLYSEAGFHPWDPSRHCWS